MEGFEYDRCESTKEGKNPKTAINFEVSFLFIREWEQNGDG